MTRTALLALILLIQEDPALERVRSGVTFPAEESVKAAAAKSEWHAKVLKTLLDPALWAESLKRIEERTGVKSDRLEIAISLATIERFPARGSGRGGRGTVELDVDQLAKYAESAAVHDRLKRKGVATLVPPARTELVVPHELTHCFQGVDQPSWFLEGMASYVARDPNHVLGFRAGKQKVALIDEDIAIEWIYARGWAFFEWLESKGGAGAVKATIADALSGTPASEAAAKATGLAWDDLRKQERDWSAAWIRKFKEGR